MTKNAKIINNYLFQDSSLSDIDVRNICEEVIRGMWHHHDESSMFINFT